MIEIRVFGQNPNFLAKNKMQREARATCIGSRVRLPRSLLAIRSLAHREKIVFYFLFFYKIFKKKKKTNTFTCIRIPIRMNSWGRTHECEYVNLWLQLSTPVILYGFAYATSLRHLCAFITDR